MTVNITWSTTQGGSQVAEALTGGSTGVDHGDGSNGDILSARNLWLSHDGNNEITSCGFYIAAFSGTYGGGASAAADLAELLAWGDGADADAFGGFMVNMNASNFSTGWSSLSYSSKGTVSSTVAACRTGVGDSSNNKINLNIDMGSAITSSGTFAAGNDDANFECRVEIPLDEVTPGVRQFEQRLRFTYTS